MTTLTPEQQRAVDAVTAAPARVADPRAGHDQVLLSSDDFDWARGLVGDLPDVPRAVDPRTQAAYALVPADVYERVKAFFEEDPITTAERQALLREFGRRADWGTSAADDVTG
jgi:hypothetical protein